MASKNRIPSVYHRRVYIKNFGPIPKEPNGRSYEIHHIDGNPNNNDPSNLVALTIQEHYDIHYERGDVGACLAIAKQRLGKTPEELSQLAKEMNRRRVEDGTHTFLKRLDGTSVASDRVASGDHNFIGGEIQRKSNADRVSKNEHNFQKDDSPNYIKVCCLDCKKEVNLTTFYKHHGEQCGTTKFNRENHPNFDATLYSFENIKTGEIEVITQYDFVRKYGLTQACVSLMTKGRQKTHKGWRITATININGE